MKNTYFILIIGSLFFNACKTTYQKANNSDFPVMRDRYFGEKLPGLIPKLFDPKIVSPEGLFEGGSFSSDMREYYFSRKNGKYKNRTFFVIRYENGRWGNESETDIKWPTFSKDGTMMYGGKWYKKRTDTGWSKLINQGEFLKDQAHGISRSSIGTYYFGFYRKEDNGSGSIRYSRLINGAYETPQKMSVSINKGKYIAHPFIAPDESYLMWDVVREDGYGGSDIYISFRAKDGSWMPAINMGEQINTALEESSPSVSQDGKYLFFSRGEWKSREDGSRYWTAGPYWVDIKIIETLRPDPDLQNSAAITYPIAYGADGICLSNVEGTSKIKLTEGPHGYPAWSPDGKKIAFYGKYDDKKTWSIHTMNNDGTNRQRLTHAKNKWDNAPDWSPDEKKIVFAREYGDSENVWHYEIWIMNADGSNKTQIKQLKGSNPYFTPDGRSIVFSWEFEDKSSAISIANVDGTNITRLTQNNSREWHPEVSPDGKQITFMSDRDGNFEIYVMNIDGSNQKRLTNSSIDDWYPSWSPDSSQIIFSNTTGTDKKSRIIYVMNKDGSAVQKIIEHGSQAAWLKNVE